jgi:hypothetical protein
MGEDRGFDPWLPRAAFILPPTRGIVVRWPVGPAYQVYWTRMWDPAIRHAGSTRQSEGPT